VDRIAGIETVCLSRMHDRDQQWFTAKYRTVKADCCLVLVHTESGRTGIGEASAYGNPTKISGHIKDLAPMLIGRTVSQCEWLHPNGRQQSFDCAVAGLDTALWDLRGQLLSQPVAKLINEKAMTQVEVYASGGCRYDWRVDPDQLIAEARQYQNQGFRAFKFRLGTFWDWDAVTSDRFIELVTALVNATDSHLNLMVDGNCRLSERQALDIGRALAQLGRFLWFEEPIDSKDLQGYQRLSRALDIPISGGESFSTLEQMMPYFTSHAFSIVQQDVGLCGITEAVHIGEIASSYEIRTVPHNWHNGVVTLANAHAVAALEPAPLVEMNMLQGPLQWGILDGPMPISEGWLDISRQEGIGANLAPDISKRYPFIEGYYGVAVER